MDEEQDNLQHLGFFGTCRESIIIICRYPKLFLQITLTLILPLAFLFLANIHLSKYMVTKIQYGGFGLYIWTKYVQVDHHWLIHLAYFTLLLGFSILSSSSVVFTVACIYADKETDLRTVVRFAIAPRVWTRVMVTIVINLVMVFFYCAMTGYLSFALYSIVERKNHDMGSLMILGASAAIINMASFVFFNVLWQLSETVTVLEEENTYGFRALMKSWALLRGKMVSAIVVFVMINLFAGLVEAGFQRYVVGDGASGSGGVKVVYGVLSLLALSVVLLFGLVVETMFYLVCKSFHQERVSKPDLAKRLESCLVGGAGEYQSLDIVKELQLEQV